MCKSNILAILEGPFPQVAQERGKVINRLFSELFPASNHKSKPFRDGAKFALNYRINGDWSAIGYDLGTPEFDAFIAGQDHIEGLFRTAYANKRNRHVHINY